MWINISVKKWNRVVAQKGRIYKISNWNWQTKINFGIKNFKISLLSNNSEPEELIRNSAKEIWLFAKES